MEPLRVASNLIIIAWLVIVASGRSSEKTVPVALISIGGYLGLNIIFLALEGLTNPNIGAPRSMLFLLVILTTAVAARAPTHPVTGAPLFDLPEGQIEVGIGVHGEVGVYRGPHLPADELIDMLVARLTEDLAVFPEKQLLVFINGTGGTSQTELHILYRRVHQNLVERGFEIAGSVVSSLFTTQEMGGFSISLGVVDQEMKALWEAPAYSPSFFRN